MSAYRLTQGARADLREIWDKIAESNETAADRMIAKIVKRFPGLARFPESGRERPDLAPGLRSVVVKPYVVFYRLIENGVLIVRVFHGARDFRSLFGS